MDLRFSPEENKFREELRTFFREKVPASIRTKVMESRHLDKEEMVHVAQDPARQGPHRAALAQGVGRRGLDARAALHLHRGAAVQRRAAAAALQRLACAGRWSSPSAREEQKKRFLPRMAALDDWWCQGFSEPGAGSDLAGLKTTAVRQGDHYVVNGQKTWTTLAQYADWIFCLCRTDPAPRSSSASRSC